MASQRRELNEAAPNEVAWGVQRRPRI